MEWKGRIQVRIGLTEKAVGNNECDGMHIIIDEDLSENQVLVVKRSTYRQALPKIPRREIKSPMKVESLLNPQKASVYARTPKKFSKGKENSAKEGIQKRRKVAIFDDTDRYNVVNTQTDPLLGLMYGQILMGNAHSAKREIGRILKKETVKVDIMANDDARKN